MALIQSDHMCHFSRTNKTGQTTFRSLPSASTKTGKQILERTCLGKMARMVTLIDLLCKLNSDVTQ